MSIDLMTIIISQQIVCLYRFRSHLNIAGIENYSNLQDILPLCWSNPSLGNAIRHDLEPPLVQQAAFDDTVSHNSSLISHSILVTAKI